MNSPPVPRMIDVAKLIGVNQSTVSLALRDHPSISPLSRKLVRRAAEKLGYQPRALVSALMAYRRPTHDVPHATVLAFVTTSEPNAWRKSPLLCQQLAAAQGRARMHGCHIEEFPLHSPGMTSERYNSILRSRGIVGLIVAPLRHQSDTVPIQWEHFAAVAMSSTLRYPAIPRVGHDHYQSMRLAIVECRRRGYGRIGIVAQQSVIERAEEEWIACFLVEHCNTPQRAAPLITGLLTKETFLAWFRAEEPDVILMGGHDPNSILQWLACIGVQVPRDAGLASLDLLRRDGLVAGVDQHPHEIGERVVDELIGRLDRNERGTLPRALDVHIMGEWIDGPTLRSCNA